MCRRLFVSVNHFHARHVREITPRRHGDSQGHPGVPFRRVYAKNGEKRTRQEKRNFETRAVARDSARFWRVAYVCVLGADLCRPSFSRMLRSEFSGSRGWILLDLACPFQVSILRLVETSARWNGKRSQRRELAPLVRPVSGSCG